MRQGLSTTSSPHRLISFSISMLVVVSLTLRFRRRVLAG
jgi:hypothetical protein